MSVFEPPRDTCYSGTALIFTPAPAAEAPCSCSWSVPLLLGSRLSFVWVKNILVPLKAGRLPLPWRRGFVLCNAVVFLGCSSRGIWVFVSLFSQSHLHYYYIDANTRESEPKPPREHLLKQRWGSSFFGGLVRIRPWIQIQMRGRLDCLCSGETLVGKKSSLLM